MEMDIEVEEDSYESCSNLDKQLPEEEGYQEYVDPNDS